MRYHYAIGNYIIINIGPRLQQTTVVVIVVMRLKASMFPIVSHASNLNIGNKDGSGQTQETKPIFILLMNVLQGNLGMKALFHVKRPTTTLSSTANCPR